MNTFFGKISDTLKAGDAERQPDANVSIPLYVGGCVVQLSGLAAVAYQLSEPGFAYVAMFMTIVGFAVSYWLRRLGTAGRFIKAGAAFLGLVFLYMLRGGGGFFGDVVPFEARGSQEILLVCALAFTATFFSYMLVTDEAVVFTCVWAIAMIGLTGTVNINRELIFCFVVFLGAASFLLVHQNSLASGMQSVTRLSGSLDEEAEGPAGVGARRARDLVSKQTARWTLLRTQALVALACGVASIFLGFLIAIPMQMVGRNLSLATIIQRLSVPAASATRITNVAPRLTFDNLREFSVGLGPISDDPTERMTVRSQKPHYWRGRVYDNYTGRGWTNTLAEQMRWEPLTPKREQRSDGFYVFDLPDLEFPRNKVERETHRFHVNSSSFAPLYHAAEPVEVRIPTEQLSYRQDNTMGAPSGYGMEYEVVSEVPDATPADLRKSDQQYPIRIRSMYLRQGADNQTLQNLVNDILREAKATNPYDKAEALRRWVSSNCLYTLDARAVPPRRDAVEFFLMESKEGYCDLYATALTMLCRYAELPARLATGFAPGTVQEGSNPKTYVLRGSDLHAWTEVYFNGYGWVVFDATQDTPGTYAPLTTPEPVKQDPTLLDRLLAAGWVPLLLVIGGGLGMLYFVVTEVQARLSRLRLSGNATGRILANGVYDSYEAAQKRLRRYGARRTVTMTTGEFQEAVRERLGSEVADALRPLTQLTQQALYGPETVTRDDVLQSQQHLHRLTDALKKVDLRALRERDRAAEGKGAREHASVPASGQ